MSGDRQPCGCPECFIASVERAAHAPVVVAVRTNESSEWHELPELAAVGADFLDALRPRTVTLNRDDGVEREVRPAKPCCARLERGWCVLHADHGGPHAGVP